MRTETSSGKKGKGDDEIYKVHQAKFNFALQSSIFFIKQYGLVYQFENPDRQTQNNQSIT